jgi:hypothetical protein
MSRAQAKSAVVSVSTSGVLVTTTPRLRQAATSMLLNPTATLQTALRPGAAARTSSSIVLMMWQIRAFLSRSRRMSSTLGNGVSVSLYSTR